MLVQVDANSEGGLRFPTRAVKEAVKAVTVLLLSVPGEGTSLGKRELTLGTVIFAKVKTTRVVR